MRAFLLLLGLLLLGTSPAAAQNTTDDVVIRTTVRPESGAVVGQHIRVFVDVLFPGEMPRPPRVALTDTAGAQILRYESQATTMNDAIDGKAYVGQRFEFALYARRGGTLEIPAPTVTVLDAQGDEAGRLRGKPLEVSIVVPTGVDPSKPVVATDRLTLEEQWSPATSTAFKAGDALVRSITRTATDVPGMAMLDLAFSAPTGVRVYVDPPQADDRIDRGDITGRRTDRVTYVFETGGSFVIPDVTQPWWDLSSGRLRQAEGRGATVSVASVAASTPRAERWLFVAVTTAGLLAIAWWAWPRVRAIRDARQARWLASEPNAFQDLQAACRRHDAKGVYRAFILWRQRTSWPARVAPLAEEIEAVLFAGAPWSPAKADAFAQAVTAARRVLANTAPASAALPPLNPAKLSRQR